MEADDSDISDFEVGAAPGASCQVKLFGSDPQQPGGGIRAGETGFVERETEPGCSAVPRLLWPARWDQELGSGIGYTG